MKVFLLPSFLPSCRDFYRGSTQKREGDFGEVSRNSLELNAIFPLLFPSFLPSFSTLAPTSAQNRAGGRVRGKGGRISGKCRRERTKARFLRENRVVCTISYSFLAASGERSHLRCPSPTAICPPPPPSAEAAPSSTKTTDGARRGSIRRGGGDGTTISGSLQ